MSANNQTAPIIPQAITRLLSLSPETPLAELPQAIFARIGGANIQQQRWLQKLLPKLARQYGVQYVSNLLGRIEVASGWRQPRLAIYDHTLNLIGGAQKYGCTMAAALATVYDVSLIANRPVTLEQLSQWYDLDLSNCSLRIVPIPYFNRFPGEHIDPPHIFSRRVKNHFHAISRVSGRYDFFINNSMVEMVYPLAPVSLFICHFPERSPSSYFYVDRYDHLVCNSQYTAGWIRAKWKLAPNWLLYPPIDGASFKPMGERADIILSVARFDPGGNKQQLEMIRAFLELRQQQPAAMQNWRLALAGGSSADNPYLEKIKALIRSAGNVPVSLLTNIPAAELRHLYSRAKIFWHFCGWKQNDPALVEHFGMSAAEAMLSGCVPVVFDGGGQREIVEADISGFRFATQRQLLAFTLRLIGDEELRRKMSTAASSQAERFSRASFLSNVRELFSDLLRRYCFQS